MQLNIKNFAVLLLLLAVTLTAEADPRTPAQMKQAAVKAINQQRAKMRMAPKQAGELKTLKSAEGYEIIGQIESGFAVISKDDLVPEVLGVSTKQYNENNTNFQWWLKAVNEVVAKAASNGSPLTMVAPATLGYPTQVAPMMTTEWDQQGPYNNLCPTYSGSTKCLTGCVATAMAQVLNYFKTPEHGIGTRTIYYHGQAVTANFGENYYDWDNMLDRYEFNNYNDAQALAVATLMRDCGVAANMEYGGPNQGSGAYSQDAAEGLRDYFGFAEATCYERDDYYTGSKYYTDEEWMDMVFRALSEDGPIYYGGADSWQGGHAFVLHGYQADGKVYVNWGWSGDDDGYYDISLLNPAYYQFSVGQDMIIGVKGAPKELINEVVTLTQAGTLSSKIGDNMIGKVGTLKVSGNINSTDLRQIRRLAGINEYGESTDGLLKELDLSEAHIVSGGEAYLIDGSTLLSTTENELPQRAFYGCKQLSAVKLPAGIKTWGDGAFARCIKLGTIEIGTPAADANFVIEDEVVWNKEKTEVIAVLQTKSGEFEIPREVTRLHDYAMSACTRLSKVIIPSSITEIGAEAFSSAIGLNEIRNISKEPQTLTGANVFDAVNSRCLLYVPSGSKGKYAQKAQWSNFYDADAAKNRIKEYGSSVKVRNTFRKYGEENPEFTYIPNGDPFTGTPELSCEATPESPAGRYTITITAGTITDENVTLIDGYLIIQKRDDVAVTATANDATREVGEENPEFTMSYSDGLLFDATEPVWLVAPKLTTTATAESPEGEYPIIAEYEDAVAESYEMSVFTFVPGKLVITPSTKPEPDGINNIVNEKQTKTYYDLQGRQVTSPKSKGLYIYGGKKYVVK